MIKDAKSWEKWEREYLRKESISFHQRLQLLDEMCKEAGAFKKFPPSNPLGGLDLKIKIAKIVNV